MTDEILEKMVSSFLSVKMPQYSIGWQGGEPTLMGVDFFRQAVKYMEKYGKDGLMVSNGLQTNGTLLNDEWGEFLAKYNFLVGISIDGPKDIHDKSRFTGSGSGSHQMVMNGLDAMKRHNVEYNVLTLVSSANADNPIQIYNYLKELEVNYHQYIECVEFDANRELMPFAVQSEQWGEFVCQIFDEWYANDRFTVSVRLFDSILTSLVDNYANVCAMGTDCRQYFVVEHNGDIYPCDFYVRPELKLGNLMNGEWADFAESEMYKEFGLRKTKLNEKCEQCQWLKLCAGCCPKNRPGADLDPYSLSALCSGWEMFYKHTFSRFKSLANHIKREREKAQEMERLERQRRAAAYAKPSSQEKVGRNSPCPCGSGKKFKKCCGK